MMELIAPPETASEARKIVEDKNILGIWNDDLEDGCAVLRVLLDVEQTETISDTLSEKFGNVEIQKNFQGKREKGRHFCLVVLGHF